MIDAIATMVASDLRQRIRDRSVLIFGLLVPFALITVLNLLFSGVDDATTDVEIRVVTVGATTDELGVELTELLQGLDGVTTQLVAADEDGARAAIADGEADAAILVPAGFAESVRSGGSPTIEIVTNGDGEVAQLIVTSVVDRFVSQIGSVSTAALAAGQLGLDPIAIGGLVDRLTATPPTITTSVGETAGEQLDLQGSLVAGQASMFMFFTVGFGVIGYLQERDQGTLARLQSMPIPPSSIVAAKIVVSFVLGIVSTSVLLGVSALLFGVSFGALVPVGVLVAAAVTAATSLILVVVRLARSSEQASMATSILAIGLGTLGGSFFPIGDSGWFARLSDLTPPANVIRGLGITQAGGGVGDLGDPLRSLASFAVVAIVVAILVPRRTVA